MWVALPLVPDWRWLLERADSPWYPSMRLFRQSAWGDWAAVFESLTEALRRQVEAAHGPKIGGAERLEGAAPCGTK